MAIRMTPLNQRRWQLFRQNKRGFWSFWLFMVLFLISVFAPFIANDRPVLVSYKGEWLYPTFVDYPESKFGGFLARTDFRDPVNQEEIQANGWMIWPPIRYSYRTVNNEIPTAAPAMLPLIVASASMKQLTVEPVPTPTTVPGTTQSNAARPTRAFSSSWFMAQKGGL